MKILALDVETTGLDVDRDQVLEIGAVIDNYDTTDPLPPLSTLPAFRIAIARDRIEGHPEALAMNASLIRRIAEGDGVEMYEAIHLLRQWAREYIPTNDRGYLDNAVIAGKNVWKLDLPILMRQKDRYPHAGDSAGFTFVTRDCHHRVLDPTTLYTRPLADKAPPSMKECLKRAGLEEEYYADVDHDPVHDCLKVLALLRHHYLGAV